MYNLPMTKNCCRTVEVAMATKVNATSHCSTLAAHSADQRESSDSHLLLEVEGASRDSFCGDERS